LERRGSAQSHRMAARQIPAPIAAAWAGLAAALQLGRAVRDQTTAQAAALLRAGPDIPSPETVRPESMARLAVGCLEVECMPMEMALAAAAEFRGARTPAARAPR